MKEVLHVLHDFIGGWGSESVEGRLFCLDVILMLALFSTYNNNGGNIFAPASDNHTCRILMIIRPNL